MEMVESPSGLPTSYRDALRLDRNVRHEAGATAIHVTLAGNANLDFVSPGLRVGLASEGIACTTRVSPFGNWISETFPGAAPPSDVWVVWLSSMGASRGMTERPDTDLAAIASAALRLVDAGSNVVLVHPEALPIEDDPFSPFVAWRQSLIDHLRSMLPPSVIQLSVAHVVRRLGAERWAASRYWEQAKAPCHPDAATAVGVELAFVLSRLVKPAVRAVAIDLDDTIWGGLVGEVGPDGLDLDPDGTGRPYLALQRLLLDLSERGIPLGVVSKNDETEARRPFVERPEMILRLDDFVRFDASWAPKYEAIAAFAAQLNIGVDAVCFLDDSPKERDEARRMSPGLIVPELPESPGARVEHLVRSRYFLQPRIQEEDRLRVEFFKRTSPLPEHDLSTYLAELEMELVAMPIGPSTIERAGSLLHKTNQFNVTLWRPSAAELSAFVANSRNYAYTFRLGDRVADAGIIAVLLATVEENRAAIEAWVLSCRVFGRGVEVAIADHLRSWLESRGVDSVETVFAEGPRNAMVLDVLEAFGLCASNASDGRTTYSGDFSRLLSHHITIRES